MGLKGSATCEMTLGENMPCRGLLLGEVHSGIAQMFNVIEFARMAIGVKSASTLSTAYLNSLEYAKDRVQGPDLKNALDKSSPRVTIINHPDVRRNPNPTKSLRRRPPGVKPLRGKLARQSGLGARGRR